MRPDSPTAKGLSISKQLDAEQQQNPSVGRPYLYLAWLAAQGPHIPVEYHPPSLIDRDNKLLKLPTSAAAAAAVASSHNVGEDPSQGAREGMAQRGAVGGIAQKGVGAPQTPSTPLTHSPR